MAIFGRAKKPQLDLTDSGAVKRELSKVREQLPAAEAAVTEAQAALDTHLARREMLGIALSVARSAAWSSGRDELIVRDPEDPGAFINLRADATDEAAAVLRQRERLWSEAETEEARLRVELTLANEQRGYLRGQVRSLEERLDQLQAPPPPRRDPLALGPNAALLSRSAAPARAAASTDRRS